MYPYYSYPYKYNTQIQNYNNYSNSNYTSKNQKNAIFNKLGDNIVKTPNKPNKNIISKNIDNNNDNYQSKVIGNIYNQVDKNKSTSFFTTTPNNNSNQNSQYNINNINNNNNNYYYYNQKSSNDNLNKNIPKIISKYIFPTKGLRNIGSTCYMNATLQCLLHVSDLTLYFIDEYPKDKNTLNNININTRSRGNISRAFYNLVIGVYDSDNKNDNKKDFKPKTNIGNISYGYFNNWYGNGYGNSYSTAFSPDEFKKILGIYNEQFRRFEANDSKDLILYLLQTIHEELNYFGNKSLRLNYYPNQYNIFETYNYFTNNYNFSNFSKISMLFYGTYINSTICRQCKNILYNFQKFEFISFGMYYYNRKNFNILNGFQDNSKPSLFTGDNKFFCKICNRLQDSETTCKIFEPPNKLLINIDYGKNKIFQPSNIDFGEEIDITKFVAFDYKQKIKYKIICVCTHYGSSGQSGHYVAFCKNIKENKWYEFNDSSCHTCSINNIYGGSPYLLLYERIFE